MGDCRTTGPMVRTSLSTDSEAPGAGIEGGPTERIPRSAARDGAPRAPHSIIPLNSSLGPLPIGAQRAGWIPSRPLRFSARRQASRRHVVPGQSPVSVEIS